MWTNGLTNNYNTALTYLENGRRRCYCIFPYLYKADKGIKKFRRGGRGPDLKMVSFYPNLSRWIAACNLFVFQEVNLSVVGQGDSDKYHPTAASFQGTTTNILQPQRHLSYAFYSKHSTTDTSRLFLCWTGVKLEIFISMHQGKAEHIQTKKIKVP